MPNPNNAIEVINAAVAALAGVDAGDAAIFEAAGAAAAAQAAAEATAADAANLTSGTIPDARFPAVLPAVSGASLTNLPVSGISSADSLVANGGTLVRELGTPVVNGPNVRTVTVVFHCTTAAPGELAQGQIFTTHGSAVLAVIGGVGAAVGAGEARHTVTIDVMPGDTYEAIGQTTGGGTVTVDAWNEWE